MILVPLLKINEIYFYKESIHIIFWCKNIVYFRLNYYLLIHKFFGISQLNMFKCNFTNNKAKQCTDISRPVQESQKDYFNEMATEEPFNLDTYVK